MKRFAVSVVLIVIIAGSALAMPPDARTITWSTVVNDGDYMPTGLCDVSTVEATPPVCRHFNSYNAPSVNSDGLVVFRARSKGGDSLGEPVHGIYTRDMAAAGPIVKVLDRDTLVPEPNNRGTTFTETPSFPRIDIDSSTIAVRGNHPPVWQALDPQGNVEEQVGTSGIYSDPFGQLVTAASKLGGISYFSFYQVPERPGTPFDVFPGAPAVTDGNVIVFKGNYTAGGIGRTGIYYRELTDASLFLPDGTALGPGGGDLPVVLIANNVDTLIPDTNVIFGAVGPPSAADGKAVFAGFDNEDTPAVGGIYLVALDGSRPRLRTLVSIGEPVPGKAEAYFNRLGEALSFDGRFVAFWGAWGSKTMTVLLKCPASGNKARVAYCEKLYPDGFAVHVPIHQGIFVYDIKTRRLSSVATAPQDFTDFLYWTFSGKTAGESGEGDAEPARWRSSAFVAVSGLGRSSLHSAHYRVAFKARTGKLLAGRFADPVDGIYLAKGPGHSPLQMLVQTGMPGTLVDLQALDSVTDTPLPIREVGLERDGFRGRYLVIEVSMGDEEDGWAGIYISDIGH